MFTTDPGLSATMEAEAKVDAMMTQSDCGDVNPQAALEETGLLGIGHLRVPSTVSLGSGSAAKSVVAVGGPSVSASGGEMGMSAMWGNFKGHWGPNHDSDEHSIGSWVV